MFKKKVETFACEHCGTVVQGNGYTNHCPECFTSKHVDVEPGDRASNCGGLMPPVQIYFLHGQWSVIQRCQLCGLEKSNKVQSIDNITKLADIARRLNANLF